MSNDNGIVELVDNVVRLTEELNACNKALMENPDIAKYVKENNENRTTGSDEAFFEMAGRLPRDKSGRFKLKVAVGGDERNIAHFHVFRSEEDLRAWRNGACLYFEENKYYDHSNNTETLTRDELKDLVRILKSELKDLNITSWKYLVSLWNYNNDRYRIDPNTPMPDYNYKTITRYKEKE